MKYRHIPLVFIFILIITIFGITPLEAQEKGPIIDMHLHANAIGDHSMEEPMTGILFPESTEELRKQTLDLTLKNDKDLPEVSSNPVTNSHKKGSPPSDLTGAVEITRRDGYIKVDSSISLYYRMVGQGLDTVVVLAGAPQHMNYLEPDLRPLALTHTLLFYDQRGGGRSKPVIRDTTKLHWSQYVSDLEEIRKHFGIRRLNLQGHSWGGHLAALYAMEFPSRVNRLLLLDVGPAPYRGSPQYKSSVRLSGWTSEVARR